MFKYHYIFLKLNIFYKIFIFFIFIFVSLNLFAYQCFENPKSTYSELNISNNLYYDVIEVNPKVINNLFFIEKNKHIFNLFYGINLFIQAPINLRGHYVLHDMYGIIGLNYAYKINKKFQMNFIPLYHESSHYLDGLLKSPSRADSLKNKFTNEELDGISYECVILYLSWKISKKLAYYFGGGYYYHTTGRDLIFFLHTATEYNFYKNFCFAGDFSYINESYENSFGINTFLGYNLKKSKIGISFERQKGLGRDYKVYQTKIGFQIVYVP